MNKPLFFIAILSSMFSATLLAQQQPAGGKKEVALYEAIQHSDLEGVKGLLRQGANPNATSEYGGNTLLTTACSQEYPDLDIIRELIKAGANVLATDSTESPLESAVHARKWNNQLVHLLLDSGANANDAIDIAIGNNDTDLIRILVQAGADPLGSDRYYVDSVQNMEVPQTFRDLVKEARLLHNQVDVSNRDSVSSADEMLRWYLVINLPRTPGSLTDTVSSLDGLFVITSPDHKVREWHWDSWTGGTMPEYEQLIEYQTPLGIKMHDRNSISPETEPHDHWYNRMYEVQQNDGDMVYLPVEAFKEWSTMGGEIMSAIKINDTLLVDDTTFFEKGKSRHGSLSFEASGFDKGIRLDTDGPRLLVPISNKKLELTSRSQKYVFDGDHFVYRGIVK